MTFLVTGATGFIGSYLVAQLLRNGHQVIGADAFPDPDTAKGFCGQVELVQCDVSDAGQVGALFRSGPRIDRLVHLAYVMGAESEADPPLAMRVNALGTANVFEAACRNRVARVVFLSSESVYGRSQEIYGERLVCEEDFCAPRDHELNYSLTKVLNEHLGAKYEARYGTVIVSLRAPVVHGAGRKRGTTVWASEFASLPAQGLPVTLPFPSDDLNCYIYVEDLAEQIYLLLNKPALAHRTYNTGGHTVRGSELADLVRAVIPNAYIAFRDDLPRSPFIHSMDDARIREEFGFTMRSMAEGVRAHIARAAYALVGRLVKRNYDR